MENIANFEKEHVQLRFGVQKLPWSKLEQTWQFGRVTDIITYGIFFEKLKTRVD